MTIEPEEFKGYTEQEVAQDMATEMNQEDIYSNLQLQNKEIEPDDRVSTTRVSRNLQLGNIDNRVYIEITKRIGFLQDLSIYPKNRGGWLFKWYADEQWKILDLQMVVSNSRQGQLRKLLHSIFKNQTYNDNRQKNQMLGNFRVPK